MIIKLNNDTITNFNWSTDFHLYPRVVGFTNDGLEYSRVSLVFATNKEYDALSCTVPHVDDYQEQIRMLVDLFSFIITQTIDYVFEELRKPVSNNGNSFNLVAIIDGIIKADAKPQDRNTIDMWFSADNMIKTYLFANGISYEDYIINGTKFKLTPFSTIIGLKTQNEIVESQKQE